MYAISDHSEFALDIVLTPKPEQQDAATSFLHASKAFVLAEPGTMQWFGYKVTPDGPWCIFDTFPSEAARAAHTGGDLARALAANASELLSRAPQIDRLDVLAHKVLRGRNAPTVGVRVLMHAKPDFASIAGLRNALMARYSGVAKEDFTPYWYAFQKNEMTFGIFGAFYDEAGRRAHVAHAGTQILMSKLEDLTEGGPEVSFFDIIACKTSP
ncbi:hypothetical protein BV25DRAFT_1918931 [Artomyces pyxidatus]|uniref:Uncharacterized protein n=1 Tax=Artomyces pyxidatus TaxID=48021 RepID=A0ACB8SRI0_9AGAM|nr:hypothetical protein BV25DRAFT_1918931 [Artomyces pyxidatus]